MRILLASSEVHPYSKTGGLADMVGAFGKELARAGHQVGIVTPLHQGIKERFPLRRVDWQFNLPIEARRVNAELWAIEPAERLTVYFIHKPEYFDRAGLYNENGHDYPDNGERYIFFSKCVVHLARYLPLKPEIVHVNDWQTALVPALILGESRQNGWEMPPAAVLTIHNLAYQGFFPRSTFALTNLAWDFFTPEGVEFHGRLNSLQAGVAFADAITTVSPRYAREILTEEFGCGLDGLLRKRKGKLFGILNGVDYEEWNTTHNPNLAHSYSAEHMTGKAANKAALQREFGLPVSAKVPLFGTITRLAEQKGMDIQLGALKEMLHADIQFVLLGSGSTRYERAFKELAESFPNRASVRFGFDQVQSHRIEAGCDFYLMPSRFEPCGLNQMYSLRYGTIPIVRTTGGLDDTVIDASENSAQANGIKFTEYSSVALARAIQKAVGLYQNPELLSYFRENAMAADFSWGKTVNQFERIYDLVK